MAGDWIAMQAALWDAPEIIKLTVAHLGPGKHSAEARSQARCLIVGALFRLWTLFDSHSDDGILDGYDAETIDSIVGMTGFAHNLQHVGWLLVGEQFIQMPKFDRWLGQSAKRRVQAAERKRRERESRDGHAGSVTDDDDDDETLSRTERDKSVTTEEKRREELNTHTHTTHARSGSAERGDATEIGPALGTAAAQLGGDPLAREEYQSVVVPSKIRDHPELYAAVCRWIRHARTKITVTPDVVEAYLYEIASKPPDRAIEVINASIPVVCKSPKLYWDTKTSLTEAKSNPPPVPIKGRGRPNPKLAEED